MRNALFAATVAAATTLASGSSLAQRQPLAETEALSHIFSAFLTQADPGVLSEGVRLGPELRQVLAPATADRTKIYEALVEVAGDTFDVRKATPAEIAAYGERDGMDPVRKLPFYTLEGAERKFLIQYDHALRTAVFVGQLGLPDPTVAAKEPASTTGMVDSAHKPEAPKRVSLSWIGNFEFEQATLAAAAREAFDGEILPKLAQLAEIRYITVNGHADRKGSPEYNQRLSASRAAAVRDYLVAKGVAADKIEIFGYGKTLPVKACPGELERSALIACLAPNRRVVVEIEGIPARRELEAKTAR